MECIRGGECLRLCIRILDFGLRDADSEMFFG